MPKLRRKTSKSALKRFKFSGKGKIMHRPVNTGHFNAKESGDTRRSKHGTTQLSNDNLKDIEHLMPYHNN